jgi:putative DNA primase/helicase
MIAPIVNVSGDRIAVHKTFLKPDGSGKADLAKDEQREVCGPMKGGAVRLAKYCPDRFLLVSEGIESVLSAMRIFGLPGWASICTSGMEALELPEDVRSVAIAVDNDENGAGQCAALSARERWISEGREVRLLMPPNVGDFNDILNTVAGNA